MIGIVPDDCKGCGACCRGWAVDVYNSDLVPLNLTKRTIDGAVLMRTRKGACIALSTQNECKIYEQRPTTCRNFVRGSAECVRALRKAGK